MNSAALAIVSAHSHFVLLHDKWCLLQTSWRKIQRIQIQKMWGPANMSHPDMCHTTNGLHIEVCWAPKKLYEIQSSKKRQFLHYILWLKIYSVLFYCNLRLETLCGVCARVCVWEREKEVRNRCKLYLSRCGGWSDAAADENSWSSRRSATKPISTSRPACSITRTTDSRFSSNYKHLPWHRFGNRVSSGTADIYSTRSSSPSFLRAVCRCTSCSSTATTTETEPGDPHSQTCRAWPPDHTSGEGKQVCTCDVSSSSVIVFLFKTIVMSWMWNEISFCLINRVLICDTLHFEVMRPCHSLLYNEQHFIIGKTVIIKPHF